MNNMCLDFVNSQWYGKHEKFSELLEDRAWMESFCKKWNLSVPEFSVENISVLKNFRSSIYEMLLHISSKDKLTDGDIKTLNEYLKLGNSIESVSLKDEMYFIEKIPQTTDINWMIYKITKSLVDLITKSSIKNLKKCNNPECDWFFYDNSKNHSKKWCDNKCASLMKVRRYRANKKVKNI